jgi:hypothetical protein
VVDEVTGLFPITLGEGKEFVRRFHRHNMPPLSWKFGVGITLDDNLVGVALAGRPVALPLDTRFNIEITRVCVVETKNGNSRLYGAICRAASNLGYRVAYTYTLQSESGASLKAAGFEIDAMLDPRPTWNCAARTREQTNLFGEEQRPPEAKIRWKRELVRQHARSAQ